MTCNIRDGIENECLQTWAKSHSSIFAMKFCVTRYTIYALHKIVTCCSNLFNLLYVLFGGLYSSIFYSFRCGPLSAAKGQKLARMKLCGYRIF